MDVKNVKQIFIAKDCVRTLNVQVKDSSNSTTYLGNGELVIVDPQGNVISAANDLSGIDYIQIIQRGRTGDVVYKSSPIYGKNIKGFYAKKYAAATEKVVTIGYNGTAGSLAGTLAADTFYYVKLIPRINKVLDECKPKSFGYRSGSTTPTQADIVNGIVKRMSYDLAGETNMNVIAEALCSNAGAAITDTGDLIVTQGSKTVKATNSDAVLAVGDYLRINSTATTGYMYKVASIDAVNNLIILDRPYQQASGLVLEASNEYVSAANGAAANWGIKISGLPFKYERFNFPYVKEDFEVLVGENITSTPTTVTTVNPGTGTYEEVSDLEAFNKGYFGNLHITHPRYVPNFPQDCNSGETYDLINIKFTYSDETTANSSYHQGDVVIAVALDTLTAGQGNGGDFTIQEVLNKYIVTGYGVGSAIALTDVQ